MVEKIIVNPESVRGWGNIVMEHTVEDYSLVGSSILVDSDTVMGVESVVYTIEAEDTTISVALVSSVASCSIGDSIVLSATVTDDEEPVEGGTVTFKLGSSTTLGTDETDANGVATYTYTTTDVGSLNFTALYESHNSNTVSVVVSHDYSIAFDSSSYTTSTGDVTAYVTLLDNSNPVSGASISLTGTGSTLSATTNSSGVATFNLTGISADCTITATYENASDTATVTVGPAYLFYDDCSSSSRLSEYGNYVSLFGTSGNGTITYNSTENAYSIAKTNNRDAFTGFKLPITATDKIKITCKVKLTSTSAYNQFGIGIQQSTSKYEFIRIRGDKYFDGFKNNTNSSIGSNTNVASFSTAYYYLEISYDGSSRVARIYDNSMSLVKEWNLSSVQSYDTPSFYLAINTNSTNAYLKEIKVESL